VPVIGGRRGTLVAAPRRQPITAAHRRTAIAATGMSTTEIDFALGIAAPGSLTSGFACTSS